MKFQVSSKEFSRAVNAVSKVISKKNTISILADILLSKEGEYYYLTGSSTENSLSMRIGAIPGMYDTEFSPVCMPTQTLKDALATLSEQPVNVTIDGKTLTIEHSSGVFQMGVNDASAYPAIGNIGESVTAFDVDGKVFINAVKDASASTKDDPLHVIFGCVCVDLRCLSDGAANCISIVGTDGQTLYCYDYAKDNGSFADNGAKILIHTSLINALSDSFANVGDIHIAFDGNRAILSANGISFVITSPEGRYPDYRRVFPSESLYSVTLNTKELASAIKRVSLMASNTQMVRLQFEGENVTLSADDADFAKRATDRVGLVSSNIEEGFAIGLKCTNVTKVLDSIKTDNVVMNITAPNRPIVFCEDDDNSCLRELVMPMTLND